jgi:hypothetical protein
MILYIRWSFRPPVIEQEKYMFKLANLLDLFRFPIVSLAGTSIATCGEIAI